MDTETTAWREQRIQAESDRVALMLARPEEVDLYLDQDAEHYFVPSAWQSQTLFHLFSLIVWARQQEGERVGTIINRLGKQGKEMIEQRKTADNTDRLGA